MRQRNTILRSAIYKILLEGFIRQDEQHEIKTIPNIMFYKTGKQENNCLCKGVTANVGYNGGYN